MPTQLADLQINRYIDHTALIAATGEARIEALCLECLHHEFAAVCIHPKWVKLASSILKGSSTMVATVADFPHGANSTSLRLHAIESSILEGAQEIDLVAPLDLIESERWSELYKDLHAAARLLDSRGILKVIVEVSLFETERVRAAVRVCGDAGCHMIKTSTGIINTRPTHIADIHNIAQALTDFPEVQIKASGGIKNREQTINFIEAGAQRIGTSNALAIMEPLRG